MKLTVEKLKDMKAKWSANKAKLQGLPQRGEGEGLGRRRPLVLHRRLHGQDLSDLRFTAGVA